jgi:SAM-dependent methyltransferase
MPLVASGEALAAFAAALSLRARRVDPPPELASALDAVLQALGVADIVRDATPEDAESAAAFARTLLRQAVDFVDHPERTGGWAYTDERLLNDQGRASAGFPAIIATRIAPELPGLEARLTAKTAAVLDVGSGAAWWTVAACRAWPSARLVGLDPFEPALALARKNVAATGLDDRIELRKGSVEDLADEAAFDFVWLPAPFIPRAVLPKGISAVQRALKPGGWMLFVQFGGLTDLALALSALRTTRSGGDVYSGDEVDALLRGAGFSDVRLLPREIHPGGLFWVARRPD